MARLRQVSLDRQNLALPRFLLSLLRHPIKNFHQVIHLTSSHLIELMHSVSSIFPNFDELEDILNLLLSRISVGGSGLFITFSLILSVTGNFLP